MTGLHSGVQAIGGAALGPIAPAGAGEGWTRDCQESREMLLVCINIRRSEYIFGAPSLADEARGVP